MNGIRTIADIRARCEIDPGTGCWCWQGGKTKAGAPAIWTFDYAAGKKTSMHGARAVYQIVHGRAPLAGTRAFRTCKTVECCKPSHIVSATLKAMGSLYASSGRWKGNSLPQRLANAEKARKALGIIDTPFEVVMALRALPAEMSHAAAGRVVGVSRQAASDIRRGVNRGGVWA